jgi:putative peptidoglycan lipid II flippase
MTPTAETKLARVFAGLLPLNVAVQAVSFAAWVAFAHVLGTGTATDAYLLGLSVPVLVYGVLLTAIRVGAIPGLTDKIAEGDVAGQRAANELLAATGVVSAALGIIASAVAVAAAPFVLRSDPNLLWTTRLIIVELTPLAVLGATAGVLGAILAVRKRFAPAVAVMVFDPLFRLCFVVAWGRSLGVQALILANLLGAAATVAVLWAMVRRTGIPLKLVRPARTAFVLSVIRVSAPLLISASVLLVNPIVDRAMAGGLKAGSITALELGLRLVPTGLIVTLLIAPLAATWSARKAYGGLPAVQESLRHALSVAAIVLPPLAVLGIILRHELVTLAYDGGAFSPDAASETSAVCAMSMIGMPAMVLSVIFSTLFIVQRETLVPMKIGFANVGLNVGLNFAFRPVLGVAGIALSTSLTLVILNVAQARAARRRWGSFLPPAAVTSLIGLAGCLVVMTIAAEALMRQLPSEASRLQALTVVAVVGGVGLLVYAAGLFLGRRLIARASWRFVHLRSRLETRA